MHYSDTYEVRWGGVMMDDMHRRREYNKMRVTIKTEEEYTLHTL